jgi:hypothetical protein
MHDTIGRPPETARGVRLVDLDTAHAGLDGTFEGYASLFGRTDLGGDTVVPGAFRKSLAERGAAGIRMLFQHDPAMPIGVWLAIHEDARGLYCRGRLATEAAKAREVLALMRAGAVDGLSIGFRTVRAERDGRRPGRRLAEIDLWEISVVTFPMLPGARIAHVKGQPPPPNPARRYELWLREEAGLSRAEARTLSALPRPRRIDRFARPPAEGGWEARLAGQLREAARLVRA